MPSTKAKKRRKAVLCPRCHAQAEVTPYSILTALARILNAAEQAGIRIRFHHGAAYSRDGVILPPAKGAPWEARAFSTLPMTDLPAEDQAGDGMDD